MHFGITFAVLVLVELGAWMIVASPDRCNRTSSASDEPALSTDTPDDRLHPGIFSEFP
jgi:hypothetical protein